MTTPRFPRYVRRKFPDEGGRSQVVTTRRMRKQVARAARLLAKRYAISRTYINAVARRNDIIRSTQAEWRRRDAIGRSN